MQPEVMLEAYKPISAEVDQQAVRRARRVRTRLKPIECP